MSKSKLIDAAEKITWRQFRTEGEAYRAIIENETDRLREIRELKERIDEISNVQRRDD